MGDLALNIAVTGLTAAQTAMQIVSENLANANTPGYLAESADLTETVGYDYLGVGAGVRVSAITQAGNSLLITNAQQTQAQLSNYSAVQQVLQTAQSSFDEPSSNGLGEALSNFWNSWDGIVSNPSDPAARTAVLTSARTLTTDLNNASAQLSNLSTQTNGQLGATLSNANTLLQQMANLNNEIQQVTGSGASANSLIDQRDQVMQQLATTIGASGQAQANGTLQVTLGGPSGSVLVNGGGYASLSASGSGSSVTVSAAAHGLTVTPAIATGSVTVGGSSAGLISAMGTVAGYQTQLDGVANALASTVNTQLEAGYTAGGTTGPANDLFTGSGAAGIGVALTQPTAIAAGLTTQPGDGGNAQVLATLGNAAGGPDQAYRSLIQQVGSDVQGVNNQVATQSSVANAAQQNLQAVAGVNTDQQMVTLLNFQQAYQASAKVISTVQGAIQSLLSAVG